MLWSWKKIIGKRQKSVKKGTFLLFKSGKNHENSMEVMELFLSDAVRTLSLVFSKTYHGVRGPYIVVFDSRIFWQK